MLNPLAAHAHRVGAMYCLLLSGAAIASALVTMPSRGIGRTKPVVRARNEVPLRMCGILAVFDSRIDDDEMEKLTKELTCLLEHRGPDEVGYRGGPGFGLGHARLSIMDPAAGHQPLVSKATGAAVIHNGEIYNHAKLRARTAKERAAAGKPLYEFQTGSDSEAVLPFFEDLGEGVISQLDGMFTVIAVSADGEQVVVGRDPCGIKPLYCGWNADGRVIFASELKCLVGQVEQVEEFPPGHYWTPQKGYVRYFQPKWMTPLLDPAEPIELPTGGTNKIRETLKMAVEKRLMSDVDYGLLLSGGLDSAIVCKLMSELTDMSKIKSFTVGMANSPDVTAARAVAEVFGTDHYEYLFTPEEAFSIVPKVIYHLETYEPELIRSSIPNFFLARLAGSHLKVVLTGEGADELFAGYLYFRDCPSREAMQRETIRIYDALHNVNLQRSDRMGMAHGVEARVPFLDVEMLRMAYEEVDPAIKMHSEARMEKFCLRELFDDGDIPQDVVWRTKAMQCEGVGTDWVSILQAMCGDVVSDAEFADAATKFPLNTPHSKEEYYYRKIFEEHFKGFDKFVHVWEGGCRAGGAAWESSAYTRAGLVNTDQLKHGLMETEEAAVAQAIEAAAESDKSASAHNSPVMSVALLERRESAMAEQRRLRELTLKRKQPRTLPELLVSGGDSRLTLLDNGANAYHCPPRPVEGAVIRGSCTGSPPNVAGFDAASALLSTLPDTDDAIAVGTELDKVRQRLLEALELPEGTALVLTPSGTCAEYVPLAVARELFPSAPIRSVHTAEGETGAGGVHACGGRYFNTQVPLSQTPRTVGMPVPGFGKVELLTIAARNADGTEKDAATAFADAVAQDANDADAEAPVWVLRQVVGTKTGFTTSDIASVLAGQADPSRVLEVVDLCQLRRPLHEVAAHVRRGACVLLTGSKFFQGSAFSGAVAIPPSLVAQMRSNAESAPPLPVGLRDFITAHDVPALLPHWRRQLPAKANAGLLMRWHTALPMIEGVSAIERERAQACERVWVHRVERLVGAAEGLEIFHEESGIVSIALRRPNGRLAGKDELRQVHKWMSSDVSAAPCAQNFPLSSTPMFIGQPVSTGDFAVLRVALGAELLLELHAHSLHDDDDDAQVISKLKWVNDNFDALYNWGAANLKIDLAPYVGERQLALKSGHFGPLPERPSRDIGHSVAEAKAALLQCDAVCLDVDSTVITHEIIVEMAEDLGVGDRVREMTLKAMGGDVPFHEALRSRLALMRPSESDLEDMRERHDPAKMLSPGVLETIRLMQARGVRVFFVSGGFRQMIEPIAEACGVDKTDIYSNTLLFHADGSFKCHCPQEPTSRAGGKAKVVVDLKKEYGFKKVVMIGDGATDMEARDVVDGADAFIGFGGCKVRSKVLDGACWFVHSFAEINAVLCGK